MKINVNACYLFDHFLREDLKQSLGYNGFYSLVKYYEETEDAPSYDISLFWCWNKGTPDQLLEEEDGERVAELRKDHTFEDGEFDLNGFVDACAEELEGRGLLVHEVSGFNDTTTGKALFRRWDCL